MQVEITYVIAIINIILSVSVFYFARKRETGDDAQKSGEMIAELKTLRRDIGEMKAEVQAMRKEWGDDHDALQGLTREMAAVWKIVDALKGEKTK